MTALQQPSPTRSKRPHSNGAVALVALALATPVFLVDLLAPSAIAFEVLYAVAVLYALRAPGRSVVMGVAAICTAGAVIGSVATVVEQPDWSLIGQNLAISVIAIWIAALAGLRLRDSRRREKARADELESLMDAVPAVVFFAHDPECRVMTGNRTAYELLRVSNGNLSQSAPAGERPPHFRSYAVEDGRELKPHELPVQRAAGGEALYGCEEHLVFDDGEEAWISVNAIPLRDEAGRVRGAVAAGVDITERKRAEQQLRENERWLDTIIDQLPTGVVVFRPDGRFVRSNALVRRLGLETMPSRDPERRERWVATDERGRPVPPDQWPGARALRGESAIPGMEFHHVDDEGREWWLLVTAAPLRDSAGEVQAAVTVVQDITDAKRSEEALRESEQREKARADELETLMDAVPAVVFIAHDPECRHITGSRLASELLGVPSGANLSLTAPPSEAPTGFKVLDPNGREFSERELPVQRAARGEEVHGSEEIVERADGTRRFLFGDAIPLRDETGRTRGAVAALVDITAQKESQQRLERLTEELEERVAVRTAELAESERLYRTIGEQIEYGIWICEPDGRIRYLSDSFLELLGVSAEEATGSWGDRLPTAPQMEKVVADWREAVATQDRWDSEFQIRGRDGRDRTILGRGRPIRDEDGRVTAWAGINLDITERKANERRLQQLTVQLSQAEQRERQKLSKILHDDIQQMLVAVRVRLALLKKADGESLSAEVDRVSDLLGETIESTRTLSHELSPEILHTGGLSDALRWLVSRKYEKYELVLRVETADSAEPTEEAKVFLFQAVRELLLNVVKHAGVSEATVTLAPHGAGELCVSVSDNGRGFDPDAERARSEGAAHVGLFGIHERLEALGGSMTIDAAPGRGTTVRLFAPRADVPAADAGATPQVAAGNSTAAD